MFSLHTHELKLPNGEDALRRIMRLVRPGGWLLVEDADTDDITDGVKALGPGITVFLELWSSLMRSRGADPSIGRRLDAIIQSAGGFGEVNVIKVAIPLSQQSPGVPNIVWHTTRS